jgi:hypothetical protein
LHLYQHHFVKTRRHDVKRAGGEKTGGDSHTQKNGGWW